MAFAPRLSCAGYLVPCAQGLPLVLRHAAGLRQVPAGCRGNATSASWSSWRRGRHLPAREEATKALYNKLGIMHLKFLEAYTSRVDGWPALATTAVIIPSPRPCLCLLHPRPVALVAPVAPVAPVALEAAVGMVPVAVLMVAVGAAVVVVVAGRPQPCPRCTPRCTPLCCFPFSRARFVSCFEPRNRTGTSISQTCLMKAQGGEGTGRSCGVHPTEQRGALVKQRMVTSGCWRAVRRGPRGEQSSDHRHWGRAIHQPGGVTQPQHAVPDAQVGESARGDGVALVQVPSREAAHFQRHSTHLCFHGRDQQGVHPMAS